MGKEPPCSSTYLQTRTDHLIALGTINRHHLLRRRLGWREQRSRAGEVGVVLVVLVIAADQHDGAAAILGRRGRDA